MLQKRKRTTIPALQGNRAIIPWDSSFSCDGLVKRAYVCNKILYLIVSYNTIQGPVEHIFTKLSEYQRIIPHTNLSLQRSFELIDMRKYMVTVLEDDINYANSTFFRLIKDLQNGLQMVANCHHRIGEFHFQSLNEVLKVRAQFISKALCDGKKVRVVNILDISEKAEENLVRQFCTILRVVLPVYIQNEKFAAVLYSEKVSDHIRKDTFFSIEADKGCFLTRKENEKELYFMWKHALDRS